MAYNNFGSGSGYSAGVGAGEKFIFKATDQDIKLPESSYLRDADLVRDGMDLLLKTQTGQVTIENYFAVETPPLLIGPDSTILTPKLVNSFVKANPVYASNATMTDESPVGLVSELKGDATVTRVDGSSQTIRMGTEIYQGDIIETSGTGAVNIAFTDESSFAISENARLAIDEYVFDPSTDGGKTDFSVLKGMFVYTSGLIGREDPDDVMIETPLGSIGIRGTIIAGNVDSGEITVVEGAIVLRDFDGHEVTLANQFETAKFDIDGRGIEHMGELSASDVAGKFSSVSHVAPSLFSSINDAAAEQGQRDKAPEGEGAAEAEAAPEASNNTPANEVQPEAKAPQLKVADGDKGALNQVTKPVVGIGNDQAASTRPVSAAAEKAAAQAAASDRALDWGNSIFVPNQTEKVVARGVGSGTQSNSNAEVIFAKGIEGQAGTGTLTKVVQFNFAQLFEGRGEAYSLTDESQSLLNSLQGEQKISGVTMVDGVLTFNADMNSDWGVNGNHSFNISAKADVGGNWVTKTITFTALEIDGVSGHGATLSTMLSDLGDEIFYHNSAGVKLNGNLDEVPSTIFIKDGIGATVELYELKKHTIHAGEGGKTIKLEGDTYGNTVYGGNNEISGDTFVIGQNVNNKLYGMGGNDRFELSWNDSLDFSKLVIDGGLGHDTVVINDIGSALNLSAISKEISNIEHLQLFSQNGPKTITLSLEDVIKMTDDGNELIIEVSPDDTVIRGEGWSDGEHINGGIQYTGTHGDQSVTLLIQGATEANIIQA